MSTMIDELTKLAELRERGVLTDAEFDAQKAQLLRAQTPPAATSTSSAAAPAVLTPGGEAAPAPAAPVSHPAPTYSAAPVPSSPLAEPDEQLMRTFVGPNADYYLGKWRTMEAQNKPYSWNWAAFLLSIYWMAYRKMFQPVLIAAGAVMLLVIVGMLVPAIAVLTNMLVLGVAAGVGWRGNTLYRDHVRRSLAQLAGVNADPQSRSAAAESQGGVSMPAALGLLAVWVVVVGGLSYMQIARAQRALGAPAAFPEAAANAPGSGAAGYAAGSAAPSAGATTSPGAYPSASTGSAPQPATPTPAAAEWVIGQWGPVGSPPCSSWMRISPDHTVSDNAGNTGTWALTPGYGGTDTFVMMRPGQAPSGGPVARGPGNTMVMGTAPRTVTWQQEQC